MQHILIYRDRDHFFNDDETFHRLREAFPEADFCSQDLLQLSYKVSQKKFGALVIFAQEGISEELSQYLGKHKNHVGLHDALLIVVHAHLSGPNARQSLMMGADYLLENPLDVGYLVRLLEKQTVKTGPKVEPFYEKFSVPFPCEVETFGRVGRIEKSPPFDLTVETSLDLSVGDVFDLRHALAADLREEKLRYEVLSKSGHGLYYRYAYQYQIRWIADEGKRSAFDVWLKEHAREFSVPKVKLLFVMGEGKDRSLADFGSELLSSYLVYSNQLGEKILRHLDPQILVKEPLSQPGEETVIEWTEEKTTRSEPVLVLEEDFSQAAEDFDKFREGLFSRAAPFIRENFHLINNRYFFLNRDSLYSRFSTFAGARIWAISSHHLLLQSDRNFSDGTILQLHVSAAPEEPVLLRTDGAGEFTQDGWKISCEIIFISASVRAEILKSRPHWHSLPGERESPVSSIDRSQVSFLKLIQKPKFAKGLLAWIVGVVMAALLGFYFVSYYRNRAEAVKDSENSDSAYETFSKSVDRAFGGDKEKNSANH